MLKSGWWIAASLVLALGCGGSSSTDGNGGSAGSSSGGASSGGSGGQSGDGGLPCPTGQCSFDGGCVTPTGPQGNALCNSTSGVCFECICASPDTPIATPSGDRRIADLRVGDRVYSMDHGSLSAVPLLAVHRTAVQHHHVVRVELAGGTTLEISPGHPTADGRSFADLRAGDRLDGVLVQKAELVPYAHPFTYDVLPASDTGTYFAGGVLIGSTLAHHQPLECGATAPASLGRVDERSGR